MSDFNLAQLNSLSYIFTNSFIYGCYFHMIKALNKNLRLKTNLDKTKRQEVITMIKTEITSQKINKIINKLEKLNGLDRFINYFKLTWLKRFPKDLWDFSFRPPFVRSCSTNNYAESQFRKLKTEIGTHHMIDILIDKLFSYSVGCIVTKKVFICILSLSFYIILMFNADPVRKSYIVSKA